MYSLSFSLSLPTNSQIKGSIDTDIEKGQVFTSVAHDLGAPAISPTIGLRLEFRSPSFDVSSSLTLCVYAHDAIEKRSCIVGVASMKLFENVDG